MIEVVSAAFHYYETGVKRLNRLFALVASFLTLFIVLIVAVSIGARFFGVSLLWAHDVAQFAFVYLVFLSFAPALESGHHVAVELFEPLVPAFMKKSLDYVVALACIFFGVVLLVQLWKLTERSFADDRLAISAITIELKWIQVAGPIGLAAFVLTAVSLLGLAHRHQETSDSPPIEPA